MGDPGLERSLDRAPHAIHALAMTLGARQAPLRCPAAISIHNDGDVPRYRYLGLSPAKLLCCKRHVFGAPIRVTGIVLLAPARRLDLHNLGFLARERLVAFLYDFFGP